MNASGLLFYYYLDNSATITYFLHHWQPEILDSLLMVKPILILSKLMIAMKC